MRESLHISCLLAGAGRRQVHLNYSVKISDEVNKVG